MQASALQFAQPSTRLLQITHGIRPLHGRAVLIKLGSSTLIDGDTGVRREVLDITAKVATHFKAQGAAVHIVSSGAVALGRFLTQQDRVAGMDYIMHGQKAMAEAWRVAFAPHGIRACYHLVTDLEINDTARTLCQAPHDTVFIVNGDDVRATERDSICRDNDRLVTALTLCSSATDVLIVSRKNVEAATTGIVRGTGGLASKRECIKVLHRAGVRVRLLECNYEGMIRGVMRGMSIDAA